MRGGGSQYMEEAGKKWVSALDSVERTKLYYTSSSWSCIATMQCVGIHLKSAGKKWVMALGGFLCWCL